MNRIQLHPLGILDFYSPELWIEWARQRNVVGHFFEKTNKTRINTNSLGHLTANHRNTNWKSFHIWSHIWINTQVQRFHENIWNWAKKKKQIAHLRYDFYLSIFHLHSRLTSIVQHRQSFTFQFKIANLWQSIETFCINKFLCNNHCASHIFFHVQHEKESKLNRQDKQRRIYFYSNKITYGRLCLSTNTIISLNHTHTLAQQSTVNFQNIPIALLIEVYSMFVYRIVKVIKSSCPYMSGFFTFTSTYTYHMYTNEYSRQCVCDISYHNDIARLDVYFVCIHSFRFRNKICFFFI